MRRLAVVVLVGFVAVTVAHASSCPDDLDGDGRVTIDELLWCVNVALVGCQPAACPCDLDLDGQVTVNEIIQGVNAALNGCTAVPTFTATHTPTRTPTVTPTFTATSPPTATATYPASPNPNDCDFSLSDNTLNAPFLCGFYGQDNLGCKNLYATFIGDGQYAVVALSAASLGLPGPVVYLSVVGLSSGRRIGGAWTHSDLSDYKNFGGSTALSVRLFRGTLTLVPTVSNSSVFLPGVACRVYQNSTDNGFNAQYFGGLTSSETLAQMRAAMAAFRAYLVR